MAHTWAQSCFFTGLLFLLFTSEIPAQELAKEQPQEDNTSSAKETTTLPEMVVTEQPEQTYAVKQATTATKTDTPIMETPFAVQTVPRAVMDDQQVTKIDRALENISGVYVEEGQGVENFFNVRGFHVDDIYRNGVKARAGRNIQGARETVNLERIEVFKGPASILYGRLQPGGMINLVTKQPLTSPSYSLQQQFGSFDFYRTTVDATGPLTPNNSLLYRFNLAYENAESFRQFRENERVFLAPVLRWNIGPKTQVTVELEYLNTTDPLDYANPALGDRPAPLPRKRNLGEPGSTLDTEEQRVSLHAAHAFTDQWKLDYRFDADFLDLTIPAQAALAGLDLTTCTSTSCQMQRSLVASAGDGRTYFSSMDLTGRFSTGPIHHTLLLGGDYWRDLNFNVFRLNFVYPGIDIFRPVHTPVDPRLIQTPDLEATTDITEDWHGVYLQDQIELPYNLHLLAGFRYDDATLKRTDTSQSGGDFSKQKQRYAQDAVTPRVGLLWRPIPQLSVYGNYVEHFGTSNGRNTDGKILPPQTAQQWEFGLKTDLLDGRLIGSLAWFDLTKQNLAVSDPDPARAAAGFRVPVGEARNRGLEFDFAGELLPGWNILAAYAYIDSKITKDSQFVDGVFTSGNRGKRFYAVPRHGGSLWTTYQLQHGVWQGLKFGAGVVSRSLRQGDNENTFQLPSYALVNVTAAYEWKVANTRLIFQLNVDNVLDKKYFTTAGVSSAGIGFGPARTVLGSLRFQW